MRVKTVPRQRVSQGNANVGSVSETVTRKIENSGQRSNDEEVSKGESDGLLGANDPAGDQSKDLSVKVKERMETSIHLEKVLNMSIKVDIVSNNIVRTIIAYNLLVFKYDLFLFFFLDRRGFGASQLNSRSKLQLLALEERYEGIY